MHGKCKTQDISKTNLKNNIGYLICADQTARLCLGYKTRKEDAGHDDEGVAQ